MVDIAIVASVWGRQRTTMGGVLFWRFLREPPKGQA